MTEPLDKGKGPDEMSDELERIRTIIVERVWGNEALNADQERALADLASIEAELARLRAELDACGDLHRQSFAECAALRAQNERYEEGPVGYRIGDRVFAPEDVTVMYRTLAFSPSDPQEEG